MKKHWTVYLAGEIHSDWREEIINKATEKNLPITFSAPITDHEASDMIGAWTLGEEQQDFWRDRKGAGINAMRTGTSLDDADIVIVKFGEKYRQWNAAFDAGQASAKGKSLIIIHPEDFNHALKEVDAAANAICRDHDQVVKILEYVTTKK